MALHDRVRLDGDLVTRQHRELLRAAAREVGIDPLLVSQGSWSDGGLSGGTHGGSGAVDIRVVNIPPSKRVPFVTACRKRGAGATWLRSAAYGWSKGDHIHSLLGCGDEGDDPGLSASAKRQVALWARGLNGLTNNAPDPFPRPKVWPLTKWTVIAGRIAGRNRLVPSSHVLRVQRALKAYVGLDYTTGPGIWGKRTQDAWNRAAVKAGLTGIDLLSFLGYRYGYRPMV